MARGILLLLLGISLTIAGMGLTVSFGVMAFAGMPLLVLGLGVLSAGTEALAPRR
jgi:hypothetical protein